MITLKTFYQALLHDLENECREGIAIVVRHGEPCNYGLCNTLTLWAKGLGLLTGEQIEALEQELDASFVAAGLDDSYPFNEGDRDYYERERDDFEIWQNKARYAWVKEHAA